MSTIKSLAIVGTTPDANNSNVNIRSYVAEGFREALDGGQIFELDQSAFFSLSETWSVDWCLFIGSILLPEWQVEGQFCKARRQGSKVAVWLHDDPYELDASMRLQSGVDVVFSNDRASTLHYPSNLPVFHMPMAASRRYATPVHSRGALDYCFVGYPYANRVEFFHELELLVEESSEGFKRYLIGPNWELGRFRAAVDRRVGPDTLNKLYAEARATFYLGRDFDLSNDRYSVPASTPGPRLFEAGAAGACQIAFVPGLEVLDYFDDESEILLADSAREAFAKLRELRADPDKSLRIGLAAQRRTLSEHTYYHRAWRILKILEEL